MPPKISETAKQEGPVRSTRSKKQDGKGGKDIETETGSSGGVQSTSANTDGTGVIVKEDFESLKQYMNFLHKNTENKFEEALTDNKNEVRQSFRNMEDKIIGISTSISEIKGNFEKLEERMNTKFSSMQSTIDDLNHKLSQAQNEIQTLRQQTGSDKTLIEKKIEALQNDICSFKKTSDSKLDGMRESLKASADEHETCLERHYSEAKNLDDNLILSIAKMQASVSSNTFEINQNKKSIESMDNKLRSRNLVIEGINESAKEDIKQLIFDCINPTIGDLKKEQIKSAYRMGKARGKKPRSIIVVLDDETLRDNILSRAADIKKQNNNKYLWLNRDQNDNSRRKRNLVKACFNLLKHNKYECSMKGSLIHLDGKRYGYDELTLLPENCRPENAKSRLFDNDLSLAFHSEHVFCSNMYGALFTYKGQLYTSAEQAYQVTKVSEAGYKKLAADMLGFANPYYTKSVGGNTPSPQGWDDRSESIMKEIVREKFTQNEDLLEKLIQCPSTEFYEMTLDRRWGTGVRLPHVTKEINSKAFKGDNLLGSIVRDLKIEFSGTEVENTSYEANADLSMEGSSMFGID